MSDVSSHLPKYFSFVHRDTKIPRYHAHYYKDDLFRVTWSADTEGVRYNTKNIVEKIQDGVWIPNEDSWVDFIKGNVESAECAECENQREDLHDYLCNSCRKNLR